MPSRDFAARFRYSVTDSDQNRLAINSNFTRTVFKETFTNTLQCVFCYFAQRQTEYKHPVCKDLKYNTANISVLYFTAAHLSWRGSYI